MTDMTVADLFGVASEVTTKNDTPVPFVEWTEANFIDPVTNRHVVLELHQKRIARRALMMDKKGRSRYSLVVWSEPKKSGKTTIAGAVGAYIACNVETPNEVSCVANDQEQSAGRIYAAMLPTLRHLGWQIPPTSRGVMNDPRAYGTNGTVVRAITTKYEKEAGANQGLSLWSELWAYRGERLTRLWEEMTPPPTRKFSMRWVETYAGFIGENLLLQSLYLRVFKDFNEKELNDGVVKIWKDLPVYEIDGRTLVYWSHNPRMPWQTPEYYQDQRTSLRPATYMRLHGNWWVDSEDKFITDAMWQKSINPSMSQDRRATFALDASKNIDCTALVGSVRDDEHVDTIYSKIWEPKGKEVDFGDVERTVVELFQANKLAPPLYYDPYQCVKLAQDLRRAGVPCREFPQGVQRIKADTFLYKLYMENRMRNLPSADLRRHVMAASAKEYEEGKLRISKPGDEATPTDERLRKVDGAVAQSMSAYMAYHRKSGGWGRSGK
jgi:hypothetical protein